MANPNPIKFVNVKVDVSVVPPTVTYSGDCDAAGQVSVDIRYSPTDIWMMLWTINAAGNAGAPATLKDLSWPDGQPSWISSAGRPTVPSGQNNPAWVLTSSSTTAGQKVSYQLDIEYQGSPIIADPTIINVDGGNLLPNNLPVPTGGPGQRPPAQRPSPAPAGLSAPPSPPSPPAANRLRNSGSPRNRSNQGRLNHRAS
jgi:hypothetical protein